MIAALTAASTVCCFGISYAAHSMFPVKTVTPADILTNQSTLNTVNILSASELKTRTLKERIDAYTSGRANLQDVMIVTSERPTLNQAYVVIAKKIEQFPPDSEERGQYEFLKKAADDHFSGFVPAAPQPIPADLSGFMNRNIAPTPAVPESAPATDLPTGGRRRRSSVSQ